MNASGNSPQFLDAYAKRPAEELQPAPKAAAAADTTPSANSNRLGPGRRRTTIYADAKAIEGFFGAMEDVTLAEAKAFRAQRGRKLATADVTSAALLVATSHLEEIRYQVRRIE